MYDYRVLRIKCDIIIHLFASSHQLHARFDFSLRNHCQHLPQCPRTVTTTQRTKISLIIASQNLIFSPAFHLLCDSFQGLKILRFECIQEKGRMMIEQILVSCTVFRFNFCFSCLCFTYLVFFISFIYLFSLHRWKSS